MEEKVAIENKIIGEFMDISNFDVDVVHNTFLVCRNAPITGWFNWDDLKYHSSWDWIIPVVRKAKATKNSANYSGWGVINNALLECRSPEDVFITLLGFLEWYNYYNPVSK